MAIGADRHAVPRSLAVHDWRCCGAGLTRRPARRVIITQASLLAAIGIAFGIPLGIALGRTLWHAAADTTPLAY